jgi:hypothetical protein
VIVERIISVQGVEQDGNFMDDKQVRTADILCIYSIYIYTGCPKKMYTQG